MEMVNSMKAIHWVQVGLAAAIAAAQAPAVASDPTLGPIAHVVSAVAAVVLGLLGPYSASAFQAAK
jgi:hypothetical protein